MDVPRQHKATNQCLTRSGPFNTYIYNNTIFVGDPGQTSHFHIHGSARGALVINNIFHLAGPVSTFVPAWKTEVVPWDWTNNYDLFPEMVASIIWENNLYENANSIPAHLPFVDPVNEIVADPGFTNAGGLSPDDYVALNSMAIADLGISPFQIPGDSDGILGGLLMSEDIVGNSIVGLPDIGAIELTSEPLLGDLNCDGSVNLLDVSLFIERVSSGSFDIKADMNLDGVVNLLDVDPFIQVLSGG